MSQREDESLQKKRRRRVERLKKMIVSGILLLILIPVVVCIGLGVRLHTVNKQLDELREEHEILQEKLSQEEAKVDSFLTGLALAEERESAEVGTKGERTDAAANQEAGNITEDGKRVYLTFDDGPSSNTLEILDILAAYQVKATFFVVGSNDEADKAIYRRIVEEGHSIGVHSYSHRYQDIYQSKEAFYEDFYLMSDYIYDVTGVRPMICRLPGGSSNTVSAIPMADVVNELEEQGICCYDWNVSGSDAEGHNLTEEQIAANVLTGVDRFQTSMVLLHDGKGKSITPEALRLILEDLTKRENLQILPITEETPIILHITH